MKPGDFALRSERSRAGARQLLEQRHRNQKRLELILGYYGSDPPSASPWHDNGEGQLSRIIAIPEGIGLREGLAAVAGFSSLELDRIGRAHPNRLISGTLLTLRRTAG